MRFVPLLTLALSTAPLLAQVQRLVDSIEAPIAYLCLEPLPPSQGAERQVGPVQKLLADPSLDALFGQSGAGAANGSLGALSQVRGLLTHGSGELELVLTSIVPNGGQPLLVLRARLQRREADLLQMKLDAQELATVSRRVGGRIVYRLVSEKAATAPGQEVELALVGADLIVGNDATAMREVLEPSKVTAAGAKRQVLSADTRFTGLRQRLPLVPGSLLVYGDWQRLGQRIEGSLAGLPGALVGSSGLGSARAVMASVEPSQQDFAATLLMDFDARPVPPPMLPGRPPRRDGPGRDGPGRDGPGRDGPGRDGPGPGREGPGRDGPFEEESGIDGWFASVQPTSARNLLGELPAGGLGGLVLSVDLAGVARRSHRGAHLLHDLSRAFGDYGLDFSRNVEARLGQHGTVQLFVGEGSSAAELRALYTLRTKNKKSAVDLFADVRRVGEAASLATARTVDVKDAGKDKRTVDVLELHGRGRSDQDALFVAAHEDALLLSADLDTLVAAVDEARRSGKARARRSDAVAAAITAIGGDNVAGLFDVDLTPMFERVASAIGAPGSGTGNGQGLDPSAFPKRHVGYLDLQRNANGTVVRMRVLSSR